MKSFASLRRGITKVPMPGNSSAPKRSGVILMCAVAAVLFVGLGASCRKPERNMKADFPVESVKSDGVEVVVRLSARSIRTSDRLFFELIVQSEPIYQINLPEVPEKLGSFFVLDSQTEPPRLNDAGQMVVERIYTLEPDKPGVVEIPALEVVAIPKPNTPNHKVSELKLRSKAISVQVLSVLNGGGESFRGIAPDIQTVAETPRSLGARWPVATADWGTRQPLQLS